MCFDSVNKRLYVLGHYADGEQQSNIDLVVCLASLSFVYHKLSTESAILLLYKRVGMDTVVQ